MWIWGRDCSSPIGKTASSVILRSVHGGRTRRDHPGSSGWAWWAVKAGDVPSYVQTQCEGSGAAGKEQTGEVSRVDLPLRGKVGNG